MRNQGILLIVSGPSGVGKETIRSAILRKHPNMYYSVSWTTRAPRSKETNGKEYVFVNRETFEELIRSDQLLEYTNYNNNYYGTPRKNILEQLNKGSDVLLEIEVDGAEQVRGKFRDGVFVFILPPSLDDLSIRLRKRAKDDEETIEKRLETATLEIPRAVHYDYVIINNVVEEAVEKLLAIIEAEKNRVTRNMDVIQNIRYGANSVR